MKTVADFREVAWQIIQENRDATKGEIEEITEFLFLISKTEEGKKLIDNTIVLAKNVSLGDMGKFTVKYIIPIIKKLKPTYENSYR